MAKKRILIVTERFYPEEFLVNDLAVELKNRNCYIEVLTQVPSYPFDKIYKGYQNKLSSTDEYQGIKIHRVYTQLGYNKSTLKKVWSYIVFAYLTWKKAFFIAKSFDTIFFYHTGPATMAHSAFVFKKIYKKKCIIWTQDIWPDAVFASGVKKSPFRHSILMFYLRHLYSNFNKVLVTCHGFIPVIRSYYEQDVEYCPQWYSGKKVDASANIVNSKVQFTFLGNIGSVQNLENVCSGFMKARKKGINAQLNIVGDGVYLERLKKFVDKKNGNDIIFWGRKPSEEMPGFMEKANILIISLNSDPLFNLYIPGKFQSYLIARRPILGIINGDVADIITNNNLGYIAEPSNIDEIAKGFSFLSNNENLWKGMGERSSQFYEANYDRKGCIDKLSYILFT